MLFKRKISLSLQIDEVIKTYSDNLSDSNLNIDFNITKSMGNYGDKASITITGLPLSDIISLSTCMMNIGKKQPMRNFISLSAGYENNYNLIFQGGLFSLTTNIDKADMSITLECIAGYDISRTREIEINKKPATLSMIASILAKELNMPLKFLVEDLNFKSFSFKGNCYSLMTELKRVTNSTIKIFMTDGFLIVDSINKAGSEIFVLSSDSGLIGTPQASMQGINIKVLLNSALYVGASVELVSKKLPLMNGVYKIINLTHQGSTRSTNYYTNIMVGRVLK